MRHILVLRGRVQQEILLLLIFEEAKQAHSILECLQGVCLVRSRNVERVPTRPVGV